MFLWKHNNKAKKFKSDASKLAKSFINIIDKQYELVTICLPFGSGFLC